MGRELFNSLLSRRLVFDAHFNLNNEWIADEWLKDIGPYRQVSAALPFRRSHHHVSACISQGVANNAFQRPPSVCRHCLSLSSRASACGPSALRSNCFRICSGCWSAGAERNCSRAKSSA